MGRSIPLIDDHDHVEVIHSVLTFTLLVVGMAATISMISALCIRRKSSPPPPPPNISSAISSPELIKTSMESSELFDNDNPPQQETTMVPPSAQATTSTTALGSEDRTENIDSDVLQQNKELPLPPAMKTLRETDSSNNFANSMSNATAVKKSISSRKIDTSLSIKMPRSMSVRTQDKEEKNRKKGIKLKHEDSIWTKTIILGEKCKVPDEDEDAIIYENGGNRISAYHKKTHSAMSLSRQNSHIDPTAFPAALDKDKGIMTDHKEVSVS